MQRWIYSYLWQEKINSKWKHGYHHWRLSGPNKWIMVIPCSSSIPEKQTREHPGSKLMQPQYTNGATAPQRISPNIPARVSNFLPSYPLLPNQTDPAPGNQGLIIINIARTHRETNFKVYTRIIYHSKRSTGTAETTTSGRSSCKYNKYIYNGRGEYKWSTTRAIWPNWKKYSGLTGQFTVQSDRDNIYILFNYHYDVKNILTTPLKNRTELCILNGITKMYEKLRNRGVTPKLHIMDNEVSDNLNQYFVDSGIQLHLVPPHMYSEKFCKKGCESFQEPLYCRPMHFGP